MTAIDISDDGGFLISGYKKGQVALWDLITYKLIRLIPDVHGTDVINARIYYVDESENVFALSSEDSGKVFMVRFNKKNFIGGYGSEAKCLFNKRLKGAATIAPQKRNELYPHAFCDSSYIVAFGALNEIVLCTMQPIKEIFKIERPIFCKERSLPYIDWGHGLTPSKRDKTVPIMAFAWDRVIQLLYINEAH